MSVPKPAPLNHAASDHYIARLNAIEEFVPQGLVTIKCKPVYRLADRPATQREYTVERYKEFRAADRKFDDFPMPAAVPGDRPRPQSLRDFAHARGLPYPGKLAENLWNEQFPSPHGEVNTHLPQIRAHYARVGVRVEKKLPGDEYIVSETAYIKWWKDQQLSAEAPWDYRGGRSYHIDYIGYDNAEPVMESSTDTHMNVPLEKFYTGATIPTRGDSEIEFYNVNPSKLTRKEKTWWAGEIYRRNVRKDGMRKRTGELSKIIGEFMDVDWRTVLRASKKTEPLEGLTARTTISSEKGSGFVGISGDWKLKYPKKQSARWTAPWYIG